ncbi:hypothetical protein EYR41_002711, partial [Orbilia oligospora]
IACLQTSHTPVFFVNLGCQYQSMTTGQGQRSLVPSAGNQLFGKGVCKKARPDLDWTLHKKRAFYNFALQLHCPTTGGCHDTSIFSPDCAEEGRSRFNDPHPSVWPAGTSHPSTERQKSSHKSSVYLTNGSQRRS